MEKILIIGAGPGGLSAGMLLASLGYKVNVFEKQAYLGKRNSFIDLDGCIFDMGPTFFI